MVPLPNTNPILDGVRWEQYHATLGATLKDMAQGSWDIVKKEKAEDMIHVLDFPYNGEPPRVVIKYVIQSFGPLLTGLGSPY